MGDWGSYIGGEVQHYITGFVKYLEVVSYEDILGIIVHQHPYFYSGVLLLCVSVLYYILRRSSVSGKEEKPPIPEMVRMAEEKVEKAVEEIKEFVIPRRSQRFRKRDRVWFYGRQLIRKVEDNVKYVENVRIEKQNAGQKIMRRIAKRIIGDSSDSGSAGDLAEGKPAEDYLEEEDESFRSWVPPELQYLLKSFHMLGQFDPTIFSEIYSDIETLRVPVGAFLFRIGEPDVNIFVVQSGRIDVTTSDSSGIHEIKRVGPGETLTSLLSFIDMLTGHANSYKTVQGRAGVDSVVLRLSVEAFMKVFDKRLELLIQVVQMVMARVQRVVFVALHQYLGLSKELIRPIELMDPSSPPGMSLQMELALAGEGNDDLAREAGVRGLQAELDLEDDTYLRQAVEVRRLARGDTLMTESSYSNVALVYVIHGELTMYQVNGTSHDELYTAAGGECVGQLSMLTGEASFYTCTAKSNSLVALLSKSSFFSIVSDTPEMVLSLAHSTIRRLSPLVRKIDFALDWVTIEAGRGVVSPVYQTDSTYIILSGRLRGYTSMDGEKKLIGEYARGDMVGIVDFITGTNLKSSYLAVRDTEICIIPSQLLEFLKTTCLPVLGKLVKILGNRLVSMRAGHLGQNSQISNIRYSSIAVVASSSTVPLNPFCEELKAALSMSGPVALLHSGLVEQKFGSDVFQSRYDYRLNSWLNQQEDRHDSVIYQCDVTANTWTKRCFRHADIILILADSRVSSTVTVTEKEIESVTRRVRKELVLLWPNSTKVPSGTRDWLKKRPWLSAHFHLKLPERLEKFSASKAMKGTASRYSKHLPLEPDIHTDFARLARHLQGASIGLVLGGGGARGAAHLGMMRSIVEAGIPVDKLGGVSIGAFVGALWGIHRDVDAITEKSRQWFYNMTRWAGLLDLTYPITSLFAGKYFNWTLTQTFDEDINIEDLWLPFYCVSTDVTVSRERVHKSGCVWRYCRASMSYAWILAPICDPKDGHLLMDGCYVNNVPGDVMLNESCSHIIALDVTAIDDTELTNYGDSLSGWWLLWKRLNPFSSSITIPTQSQIQERLSFVSHYKNLEQLKQNPHYEYIQPPVGHFSSAKFEIFEEIYRTGYHHGTTFFCGLRKAGVSETNSRRAGAWLPTTDRVRMRIKRTPDRRDSGDYTFLDLANYVVAGKSWPGPSSQKRENSRKEE